MGDIDVLERVGWSCGTDAPGFDLVASKLRRPWLRPGTVRRSPLIRRLMRDGCGPVVSVVAPAGYGKTTLLAQWAEDNGQAFAWVSADEADNDPKVLLSYVAQALDAVQPVGGPVFGALASPASSVSGSVVPRLGSAFASMTVPVVLVLDDVHLLHNRECRAALSALADDVPDGSRLVLAGRDQPPLRAARLRAEGRITEIGRADLALTRGEAAALLRATGAVLSEAEVAELYLRTEGWPAGLYLAALAIRAGGSPPGAVGSFGGDDRFVSEYVESEFLARISARDREFLTRTAVLERMCGPLCEAVLGRPGAAADLAGLARSNLLLVPLDRRGAWYRYHHLFRDMLLAELERTEPGLMPVLRRRAAQWCLGNGVPEEALEYSMPAGDAERAARPVEEFSLLHPAGPDTLAGQPPTVRARRSAECDSPEPTVPSLTAAELRVLPLLATHLSFREIAAELFVSRNTVRSQAMSVYRKLGASSRSQAVARSRALGLLEPDDRLLSGQDARRMSLRSGSSGTETSPAGTSPGP
jgi:LuxR family transcriptional regulator, maltose regulon positive regulatory protein